LARSGNPSAISFPRAYLEKDSLDFSFSGIKTAVVNFVRKYVDSNQGGSIDISENNVDMTKQLPVQLADIAASFQEAVVDVLVIKTCAAAQRFDARQVVVAGGVAANSRLRERLREDVARLGLPLMLPKAELCTDNAAMVAAAGFHQLKKTGGSWDLDFDAISRWPDKTAGS
jgi:N6-L-threonylcarbamoyladenine synthase